MKNIANLFFKAAQAYPENIAITHQNQQITFEQLAQEVQFTADHFQQQGIQKGSKVMVFVPMSIDLYRIVLALFSIGATAVFLDEWADKKRILKCMEVVEIDAFVGTKKALFLTWFFKKLRNIPIRLNTNYRKMRSQEAVEIQLDETALITFTTGSTDVPKAANRTHGFLEEQFKVLKEEINAKPGTSSMVLLPIVLLCNLGTGASSVIATFNSRKPASINTSLIWKEVINNQVNQLIASPFFLLALADYLLKNKVAVPSYLKEVFTGGAPVFPADAQKMIDAFVDKDISIVYGSTEAEPISLIKATDLLKQRDNLSKNGLAVGKIHEAVQLKIIKITGEPIKLNSNISLESLEVSEGEIGEIIVAGDHVLKSYFNSEAAFKANKIVDNGKIWHRTGDSGRMVNGQLFLSGRCGQLIYHKQETLSPFVYENILQTITAINLGTILKKKGQLILAIETNLAVSKIELRKALIEKDLVFDIIQFVKQIPRDPRHFSKIDYPQLVKLI